MHLVTVVATLLIFVGNVMSIFYLRREYNRDIDITDWADLDANFIQDEWDFRLKNRPIFLSASLITALGWLFLAFPLVELSWVLSNQGKQNTTVNLGIAIFALTGAFSEFISMFLYVGGTTASNHIARYFNLDNWYANYNDQMGWKALELTHVISLGFIIFIDAIEWLCLFFIMLLVHISVRRWRVVDATVFGACWNSLGLFIGLLSLLDYISELLRLEGLRLFGPVAFWYAAVNRLILLPIWLLTLASRLPIAGMKLAQQSAPAVEGAFVA